ncbi:PDR/VanB family oxidoreductase [Variovorax sp. N23]|uniref:PDR/VanB family oxidoreductase n=1 Tax=Variovorax sp. N23 TaxID=2980555 RepID=UPI0021C5C26D|nr:PDR/VanB family oxidoreductase [Variovorax sp. N23]MCU4120818.1 PDR/VanB family oxidoreductase [Variovorax sp. N23]
MSHPATAQLTVRVAEAALLNPLIRQFRLVAADGAPLPGFEPGAHVRVQVTLPDGRTDWRHYSLIDTDGRPDTTAAPAAYCIAVRREADGRGGSRFMHEQVQPGALLQIEAPKNDFPLDAPGGATVLVAGGIGVTPLIAMAARRVAEGAPVRMHYAGRSRALMAYLPELDELLGERLSVHADDEAGRPFDVAALLDACDAEDHLYLCGPKVMLDAVLAATQARGWPTGRVHFELFTEPVVEEGDRPFEVELAQSGQRFTVAADQSLLDCLIENGCDPMFDCKRGECGVCAVPVIDGEIDHRDYVLSAREKAEGNVMQICISRAKGARLVLDL